jgi:carbon-monoxide dehydrogenase iron sulfur subunit
VATGFEIKAQKCTECERCMAACSMVKLNRVQLRRARITIGVSWPELPVINVCRFDDCVEQPCINACPVGAISNNEGIVLIDREICTCCRACIEECPYHAIWMDEKGLAYKCDFCGGEPVCVLECVTGAIRIKGR